MLLCLWLIWRVIFSHGGPQSTCWSLVVVFVVCSIVAFWPRHRRCGAMQLAFIAASSLMSFGVSLAEGFDRACWEIHSRGFAVVKVRELTMACTKTWVAY